MEAIRIGDENVPCDNAYWATAKNVAEVAVRHMRAVSGQEAYDGYDEVPIRGEVFSEVLDALMPQFQTMADHFGRPRDEVNEQMQLLISIKAMFRVAAAAL